MSHSSSTNDIILAGVSFGGVMMLEQNPRLDVVYYGDTEDDFLEHLSSHIKHTLSVCVSGIIPTIIRHP